MLSFIRGIESFESPLFFGTPAGIKVHHHRRSTNSITQRAPPDYQSATAMGFASLALMFLLLVLQMAPAARQELHDRHRQGLLAERHAARPDGAG